MKLVEFDEGFDEGLEFKTGRGTYVVDNYHVNMLNITKKTKSLSKKEREVIEITTLATEIARRLELSNYQIKNFVAVFSNIYPKIRKNNKLMLSTIISMKQLGIIIDTSDIYEKFSDYIENIEQAEKIIYDALEYMHKHGIPYKVVPFVDYINYYINKASRSLNIEKYRTSIFNVAMSISKQNPSSRPNTIVGQAIKIVSDIYGLDITSEDIGKALNVHRNISINNIEVVII